MSWKQHRLTKVPWGSGVFITNTMRITQRVRLSPTTGRCSSQPVKFTCWDPTAACRCTSLWQKRTSQISPCCLFTPVAHNLYTTHRITTWQSGRATGGHQPNLSVSRWNSEAQSLINSPQGAGGGGGSGTLSPASQPAPPAKEILQKLFQPSENRHQYWRWFWEQPGNTGYSLGKAATKIIFHVSLQTSCLYKGKCLSWGL